MTNFYEKEEIISALSEEIEECYLILDFFKEILNKEELILVDVGAHKGSCFLKHITDDIKVYAFEPDKENILILKKNCINKSNVIIEDIALSNKEGIMPFFTSEISSGISGLSSFDISHKESYMVKVSTLNNYCEQEKIKNIDFLKIDTEGYDKFILEGLDFKKIRPKVILTEYEDKKTFPLGYLFEDYIKFLKAKGYYIIVSEWFPLVKYGIQHRWNKLHLKFNKLENSSSWGNIIAFEDKEEYKLFQDSVLYIMIEEQNKNFLQLQVKLKNRDKAIEDKKEEVAKLQIKLKNRDKAIFDKKEEVLKLQLKIRNRDKAIEDNKKEIVKLQVKNKYKTIRDRFISNIKKVLK